MPDWADSVGDWSQIIAIAAAISAFFLYLVRAEIRRHLTPNHGSSLRDAVDRIEAKLDSHIDWHMDRDGK